LVSRLCRSICELFPDPYVLPPLLTTQKPTLNLSASAKQVLNNLSVQIHVIIQRNLVKKGGLFYSILLSLFLGHSGQFCVGQNIANPDFEDFTECPEFLGQVDFASPWEEVINSADYYNCDLSLDAAYNTPNGPSSGSGAISIGTYGNLVGAAESVGQLLAIPFEEGLEYTFEVDVMKPTEGLGSSFANVCTGLCFYGFSEPPPTFFSFIHTSDLDGAVLLDCTEEIDNNDWETKTISFTAPEDLTYLVVTPGIAPECFQIIFVDNIRQIEDEEPELSLTISGPDTICSGEANTLIAQFSGGELVWNDGSELSELTITRGGTYTATVTAPSGESVNASFTVVEISPPQLSVSGGTYCLGDTVSIRAFGEADSIYWPQRSTDETVVVDSPGEYTAIAENGCGQISRTIAVDFIDCSCEVYIPNAFTPDGNGINDVFKPVSTCDFSYYSMSIFNRWGERIFYSRDPGKPWRGEGIADGNYFSPNQVYTYVVEFENANRPIEDREVLRGQIALIR